MQRINKLSNALEGSLVRADPSLLALTCRAGSETPTDVSLPFWLTISRSGHSVLCNWGFHMSSRLRAASLLLLIAVAGVSVLPKIDLPETAFDESDTPTIQTILTTNATLF